MRSSFTLALLWSAACSTNEGTANSESSSPPPPSSSSTETIESESTNTSGSIPEADTSSSTSSPTTTPSPASTSTSTSASTSGLSDPTGSEDSSSTTDEPAASESTGELDPQLLVLESFDQGGPTDGWPRPWQDLGGLLAHGIDAQDRGWLRGQPSTVGRLYMPGFSELDVDMVATITFEGWQHQGVGLYARQNGGWLVNSDPPGQGYAAYAEGGFLQSLGIWRELDGVEESLATVPLPVPLTDEVPYRMRFECQQNGGVTELRAKLWPADQPEPGAWDLEITDDTPVLQNQPGGFAVDLYNYLDPKDLFIDDIEIRALP